MLIDPSTSTSQKHSPTIITCTLSSLPQSFPGQHKSNTTQNVSLVLTPLPKDRAPPRRAGSPQAAPLEVRSDRSPRHQRRHHRLTSGLPLLAEDRRGGRRGYTHHNGKRPCQTCPRLMCEANLVVPAGRRRVPRYGADEFVWALCGRVSAQVVRLLGYSHGHCVHRDASGRGYYSYAGGAACSVYGVDSHLL